MLERYDEELAEERDKSVLRNKGRKGTTIKTLCGEVEYRRRVYQTKTEAGSCKQTIGRRRGLPRA